MKKAKAANEPDDEMRAEYRREDFGAMARGKYAKACREASNVVVIAPEVQKAFPNAQAVNDALRGLLELARRAPRALDEAASWAAVLDGGEAAGDLAVGDGGRRGEVDRASGTVGCGLADGIRLVAGEERRIRPHRIGPGLKPIRLPQDHPRNRRPTCRS